MTPSENGTRDTYVPDPVVFWACPAEEYGKFASSPFERVNLGYEGLFGPKTVFYHLTPQPAVEGGELVQKVQVPVLDTSKAWYVEWGTVVAVLLGALLVGLPLVRVLAREFSQRLSDTQAQKTTTSKKEESKKKK